VEIKARRSGEVTLVNLKEAPERIMAMIAAEA